MQGDIQVKHRHQNWGAREVKVSQFYLSLHRMVGKQPLLFLILVVPQYEQAGSYSNEVKCMLGSYTENIDEEVINI